MFDITPFSKPLKLFTALACAAALATPTAAAQEQKERVGIYTSTTLGQATTSDVDCEGFRQCEDTEFFAGLLIGFQFNSYVAAEFGYGAASGFDIRNDSVFANTDYSTFSLGTQLSYPVTPDFSVFGRLGMHRWASETRVVLQNGGRADVETDGTDPYFGVGAEYAFDGIFDEGSLVIGANYTRYQGDDVDLDAYGVSIKFLQQF